MYEMKEKIHIFDLDGTLADSMPIAVDIVLDLLREYHIPFTSEIVNVLIPLGFEGIAKYYAEHMGVPMTADEVFGWFTKRLQVAYAEKIPLKDTAKETVEKLHEQGVRMCVLTASPHQFTDPFLKRTGLYDLFDEVWSSHDFHLSKGNPRLYEEVAKRLGVRTKDLLMIDDSITVIKPAHEAGVCTIGVYDSYSAQFTEAICGLADKYVDRLIEIL